MKVIQLEVSNVKRLKAVSLKPQGDTVVIGGRNEQGKSTVLDSILMALAGKDAICEKPIREGQTKAEVTVDLGELVVTRRFTGTGTTLVVKDKDGRSVASPQTVLDKLCGSLTFDPLAFSRMDSKMQRETLARLAGLDLSGIQREYELAYQQRRDANRELDRLNHQLAGRDSEGPYEEISTTDLLIQLNEAEAANRKKSDAEVEAGNQKHKLLSADQKVLVIEDRINQLRHEISLAESELRLAKEKRGELDAIYITQRNYAANLPVADVAPIKQAIASAAEQNAKIRENIKIKSIQEEAANAKLNALRLDAAVKLAEDKKAHAVQTAAYPLPGLSVTDDCVLFNGIPLKQASTAQQIRISSAIGIALNPKLRVMLIRDGAFLDDANLAALREMAEDNDVQLWIERVGKGQEVSVVIEDGEVSEDRKA